MTTSLFICNNCDAQFLKWTGRCLECGRWGSVEAQTITPSTTEARLKQAAAPASSRPLAELSSEKPARQQTASAELDRVLGGGIAAGSLILLGGEPGIGKSTLALKMASSVPGCLYCSGEEAASNVAARAARINAAVPATIRITEATNAETLIATLQHEKPTLAVIDSIQTLWSSQAEGTAGGVTQMRACTALLVEAVRQSNAAVVIIGHVTKEGAVAGPRTLEHLVDTVLYLEGDRYRDYRLLRAVKNRFGTTDEVGIFTMTPNGLQDAKNPSSVFIKDRGGPVSGSVLTCIMEGSRPLLVEVQALITKTTFGNPARRASGFGSNRLQILIATLQRRTGLDLSAYDVHLNIVGGIVAKEPAADLAVCLAIASGYKDKALPCELVAFGEVGLGGEVRPVSRQEKRIKECLQLGMRRIIAPHSSTAAHGKNTAILAVKNLEELIRTAA